MTSEKTIYTATKEVEYNGETYNRGDLVHLNHGDEPFEGLVLANAPAPEKEETVADDEYDPKPTTVDEGAGDQEDGDE